MKNEGYSLTDLHRLLLGRAPWSFALEVMLRTCFVYVLLVTVVRLLGKRMSGQLSNLELAVMIVLGAIVSAPMQVPQRGIVPGALLLGLLLVLQRTLSVLGTRSARLERTIQGPTSILVKDGRIEVHALERARISHEQLFSILRVQKYLHLGQLRRVYLESNGSLSSLRAGNPQPGLSVAPAFDRDRQPPPGRSTSLVACSRCGNVRPASPPPGPCGACGNETWRPAIGETGGDERGPTRARGDSSEVHSEQQS
jgi:uncharacterized membrane protein YcaP (DUF421 family)